MGKTDMAYAAACEISRELGLSLSNGEARALAEFLGGMGDQEKASAALLAGGEDGARELVRKLRAA